MSTTWGLTADQIVSQACYNLGLAQPGRSVRAEHRQQGFLLLNAILKRMPHYGWQFPKMVDAQFNFAINAGDSQPVAGPSDFLAAPFIKVMEDLYRDGFGREDDATSLGEPDQGGDYNIATGSVYGIASGKAYAVSGFTGPAWMDTGSSDGVFGVQLKAILAAHTPYLAFRVRDYQNYLRLKMHSATQYTLEKVVAGAAGVLATYTVTPAADDWLYAQCIGQAITPLISGAAQTTVYTDQFEDETGLGFGAVGATPRFKNLFYSTGKEREANVVMAGRWQGRDNPLQTADYPSEFFIDADGDIHPWPVPEYPVRCKMLYQAKLSDLVSQTAPDMPADMHLTLIHMLTEQLAIPTGRTKQAAASSKDVSENLPLGVAFNVDPGDAIFDYDE